MCILLYYWANKMMMMIFFSNFGNLQFGICHETCFKMAILTTALRQSNSAQYFYFSETFCGYLQQMSQNPIAITKYK